MEREKMDYPKREQFFVNKFARLIGRMCVANEIGSDACFLLLTIAHTEDAKRYRAPVTYFNEQLFPVCGFGSVKALDRARQRAIDAGWLCYQSGGKGKAGKYYVTIPERYESIPDGDAACDFPGVSLDTSDQQTARQPPDNRQTSGEETAREVANILPTPIPTPNPSPLAASAACTELAQEQASAPAPAVVPSEFTFPITGKGPDSWTLPQDKLDEYIEAFPSLDVPAAMVKARLWCRNNPKRRKTATGMLAFLTTWLNRETNSPVGGRGTGPPSIADPRGNYAARQAYLEMTGCDDGQ
jgi:hypothetical protein